MPEHTEKHSINSPVEESTAKASKVLPSPLGFSSLEQVPRLLVKKNSPSAQLPKRGSPHAAGYDLTAAVEVVIPARGKGLVDTGLSLSIPAGHYGRVAPRSGLASKQFIDVGAGVIDCDYRGPLFVLLFNFSEVDFRVAPGDRIAQLVLERISTPEVEEVEALDATVRGSGGFGSTGLSTPIS